MQEKNTTISRGLLPIYYSTTSGMSKDLAYQFQSKAEQIGFIAPIMNVGDIDSQDFLNYQGPIIMFLSTYGNGDSPQDGQPFLQWIQSLQGYQLLNKISFMILALGNSSFQHFCGHGRRVTQALLTHGAEMLLQTKKCDAHIDAENSQKVFPIWSQKALDILTIKYSLRSIPIENLTSGLTIEITNKQIDWEVQIQKIQQHKLNRQFSTFVKSQKTQVVNIQQLRGDTKQSGRSTVCITIKKPKNLNLWPACNVNIYPLNIVPIEQGQQDKVIEFRAKKMSTKIPFPPMKISELKKLVNLRQKSSNKLIQNAILLSKQPEQVKQKYRKIIKQRKSEQILCQQILNQLKPSFQFYADLGVNLARSYTLASWKQSDDTFEICVSLIKNGLASLYFQSMPKQIRINSCQSTFSIPQKSPLIMIANGTGIAPFRSIIHYISQIQPQKRIPLRLYFGIQNSQTDYYFKEQFEKYQKEGLVQLRIAESRKDPNKKLYVQDLIESDKELIREHLFKKQGRIFLCGGKQMSKGVNNAIFKAIVLQCKMPYKGFTILNNFKSQKIIVEEVFG